MCCCFATTVQEESDATGSRYIISNLPSPITVHIFYCPAASATGSSKKCQPYDFEALVPCAPEVYQAGQGAGDGLLSH
jgi:hypothetical protein